MQLTAYYVQMLLAYESFFFLIVDLLTFTIFIIKALEIKFYCSECRGSS